MQLSPLGDNLHEMSKTYFLGKIKKILKMQSTEMFSQHAKCINCFFLAHAKAINAKIHKCKYDSGNNYLLNNLSVVYKFLGMFWKTNLR